MLKIFVPPSEDFNETTGEFVIFDGYTLYLEHSLVSISKWESKWHVPYMTDPDDKKYPKTEEMIFDYVKCMTINKDVDPSVYDHLTTKNVDDIKNYIENPMTATWFREDTKKGPKSKEYTTSEVIYYWMVSLQIPWECEKWHLNRLLTLIRVCNSKNNPNNKMSKKDILKNNAALNKARRAASGSKG